MTKEKLFSVWFESETLFAERKIKAPDAFIAIIRCSIQLASEGGTPAGIVAAGESVQIHVKEVE